MARFSLRRPKEPERRPTNDEIIADLRDPLPPGHLEWGFPTRCPQCEDWGYLDRIDLVDSVMQLHCPTCHARWQISQDQIEAVNSANQTSAG